MSNPISESIDYLVECGWDREQAVNLVAAIKREELEQAFSPDWVNYLHGLIDGAQEKSIDNFS